MHHVAVACKHASDGRCDAQYIIVASLLPPGTEATMFALGMGLINFGTIMVRRAASPTGGTARQMGGALVS
jgi:hypothetical protein